MKMWLRPVGISLTTLMMAALVGTAAPAHASHGYFFYITGPGGLNCTPGGGATLSESFSANAVGYDIDYTVTNPRTGTSSTTHLEDYNYVGDYSGGDQWTTIPAGTQPGDVLIHHAVMHNDGAVYTDSTLAWVCDTGVIVSLTGACGIYDERINSDSCAGPVALYCGDEGLEVWDIDPVTGEGTLAFTFSGSFETPTSNALLMQDGDIELWQLDTGEFQVNADQGEGKTYAFVFNGCPYDGGGYNANLDPTEQEDSAEQ